MIGSYGAQFRLKLGCAFQSREKSPHSFPWGAWFEGLDSFLFYSAESLTVAEKTFLLGFHRFVYLAEGFANFIKGYDSWVANFRKKELAGCLTASDKKNYDCLTVRIERKKTSFFCRRNPSEKEYVCRVKSKTRGFFYKSS